MMIPNKMWEAFYLKPLPEQERQVWDYIYRYTVGWGGEMKEISTYTIAKDLNILDVNVRRVIRALKAKKRIIVKGKMKGIQENYNLWTLEQIRSIKKIEQIGSNTRANKLVSLEQDGSLIKDTLKDKIKEKGFSTSPGKKRKRKIPEGLKKLRKDLKKLPGRKK